MEDQVVHGLKPHVLSFMSPAGFFACLLYVFVCIYLYVPLFFAYSHRVQRWLYHLVFELKYSKVDASSLLW